MLVAADTAADRVGAVASAIRAYEAGLQAMRAGLRGVALEEERLTRQLAAQDADAANLLATLQRIEHAPPPLLVTHPGGPLGAAHAAMMLAQMSEGLRAKAAALRSDLAAVAEIRALQEQSLTVLQDGLSGAQDARVALQQALAERSALPLHFVEDPVRTAILLDSVETLAAFADGLDQLTAQSLPPVSTDVSAEKGTLPLPVRGRVLYKAGEPDAAGIRRDGLVLSADAGALVTAPVAASVRYAGPLLDLDNVVILEPQADLLFVIAGLDKLYARTGEVLPKDAPLGLLPGTAGVDVNLSTSGEGAGHVGQETLYIDVREGSRPVDPDVWFDTETDG
jgi:septal ring factor EnvC (AmiA/AmiB activator)